MVKNFTPSEIQNPVTNQSTCIYAFHDAGSQLMLLRSSVAKEIGLKGLPIIQSCSGMNSTVERKMEIANLRIRGFSENDTFNLDEVRLTDVVPKLPHSLPNDFDINSHENFSDITYPIINRDCCDMLIGADNINLIHPTDGTDSHRISGSLQAIHSRLGWVISGCLTSNVKIYISTIIMLMMRFRITNLTY